MISFDQAGLLPGESERLLQRVVSTLQHQHGEVMPFMWTLAINFAVFFALYKYRRYTIFLHFFLGLGVASVTVITSLPMVFEKSLPPQTGKHRTHYLIGVVVIFLVILEVVIGCLAKLLNLCDTPSLVIYRLNKFHAVLGYTLMLLCKFQVYYGLQMDNHLFAPLLIQQIVFTVVLVIRKLYFPHLQYKIHPQCEDIQSICKITSLDDLKVAKYNSEEKDYCIFGNLVYDMKPLKLVHPPGYQILNFVKNREIDRFVYGMMPAQIQPRIPPNSHSARSFYLLSQPIAQISIAGPYKSLPQDIFDATLHSINLISRKGSIYEIYLKVAESVTYEGFTDIKQLGRFYTLTLDNQITRLYTAVNFIRKSNLRLLKIAGLLTDVYYDNVLLKNSKTKDEQIISERLTNEKKSQCENIIPLMMKVYSKGNLPKLLVEEKFERLQLSPPKGQGLGSFLKEYRKSTLLIVTGGTGIYPFSDLIDLLYKDHLIKAKDTQFTLINEILKMNPVLKTDPFKDITFKFLIAFNHLEDIHPITLKQLKELTNRSHFSMKMRVRQNEVEAKTLGFSLVNKHFELILDSELKHIDNLGKIWLCGPPRMCIVLSSYFESRFPNQDMLYIV